MGRTRFCGSVDWCVPFSRRLLRAPLTSLLRCAGQRPLGDGSRSRSDHHWSVRSAAPAYRRREDGCGRSLALGRRRQKRTAQEEVRVAWSSSFWCLQLTIVPTRLKEQLEKLKRNQERRLVRKNQKLGIPTGAMGVGGKRAMKPETVRIVSFLVCFRR